MSSYNAALLQRNEQTEQILQNLTQADAEAKNDIQLRLQNKTDIAEIDTILLEINKKMANVNTEILSIIEFYINPYDTVADKFPSIDAQQNNISNTLNLIFDIIQTISDYIDQIKGMMKPEYVRADEGISHSLNLPHSYYLWKYSYYMHCFRLRLLEIEEFRRDRDKIGDSVMDIVAIQSSQDPNIRRNFTKSVNILHSLFQSSSSWQKLFAKWNSRRINPSLEFSIARMLAMFRKMTDAQKYYKKLPDPPIYWNLLEYLQKEFYDYPINNNLPVTPIDVSRPRPPPPGWSRTVFGPTESIKSISGFFFDKDEDEGKLEGGYKAIERLEGGKRKKNKKSKKSKKNPRKNLKKKFYTLRNKFK